MSNFLLISEFTHIINKLYYHDAFMVLRSEFLAHPIFRGYNLPDIRPPDTIRMNPDFSSIEHIGHQ